MSNLLKPCVVCATCLLIGLFSEASLAQATSPPVNTTGGASGSGGAVVGAMANSDDGTGSPMDGNGSDGTGSDESSNGET